MSCVTIRLSNISNMEESEFLYDIAGESCLFDVLNAWSAQNAPGPLKRIFDPEIGSIAGSILILLNGRSVKSKDPKTTMVSPGDVITIMPVLIGG